MASTTTPFGATLDMLFFQLLPYAVMVLFFVGTIYRYVSRQFTFSSLSSQFLESRHLFWGSVPFHYGILVLALGHAIGLLYPNRLLLWNAVPARVAIIEVAAFIFALLTLVGLVNLILRRFTDSKARAVTSTVDWVVYGLLLAQVVTGMWVAIFNGWGTSWYATSAVPYLRSLLSLQPNVSFVSPLPMMARFHIIGAWLTIGLFPFCRLVHILVVPNPYLWRKWQMVRWPWDRGSIRRPE
jgi:nitrate reductase gamma subunit